jgi:predicted dehydrogenase
MVAGTAARGVLLATVFMRRYAENLAALRATLLAQELGTIQAVSGWYIGGTLHNGSHWFDMLRYLVGEVSWVQSYDGLREPGNDPTLDIVMGLEGGQLATLRASDVRKYTLFEMDILTTEGRVQITDSGHRITVWRAAASPRYSGYVELEQVDQLFGHRRDLMLHAVEDVVDALATGRQPLSTGDDGLAALRIAEAALTSRGKRIEVA